ncbi:MAG: hypothetical protein N3A61_05195 [Ignavibacteria bacterium]|nr:hypothetical protein [Ignavibacteria bacterium]
MNTKRFIIALVVVFVVLEILGYLIYNLILASQYQAEELKSVFRSMEDMSSKMWVMWVTDLIWSFFFVFLFAKGYENRGIMEGVRFGFYIGIFWGMVSAYQSYVICPLPYSLIFQWFIYSLIMMIILGVLTALIYKPKEEVKQA